MNIAIVGCGYVADSYLRSLERHPELKLTGAWDRDQLRAASLADHASVHRYASLTELLDDPAVDIVLNLTSPRSHFDVTRQSLEGGKHVYSEKPLAMESRAACELVALAESRGVYLASAPCSVLGETAQTIWKALHDGLIGRVRLVYANLDDGMIAPHEAPWNWKTERGVPWPARDEFEVGCTYEHAGYALTWLAAFFGPAKAVTAFASCQLPDKGIAVQTMAPDFSVGCVEYADGVVARVTCGLVAPRDRSLTIVGERGVLHTHNVRDESCPVYLRPTTPGAVQAAIQRRLNTWRARLQDWLPVVPWSGGDWRFQRKLPFARKPVHKYAGAHKAVDFARGPAELAEAVRERRPCRLSARLGLHITELIETLQYPEQFGRRRVIGSEFASIEPLPWLPDS